MHPVSRLTPDLITVSTQGPPLGFPSSCCSTEPHSVFSHRVAVDAIGWDSCSDLAGPVSQGILHWGLTDVPCGLELLEHVPLSSDH